MHLDIILNSIIEFQTVLTNDLTKWRASKCHGRARRLPPPLAKNRPAQLNKFRPAKRLVKEWRVKIAQKGVNGQWEEQVSSPSDCRCQSWMVQW